MHINVGTTLNQFPEFHVHYLDVIPLFTFLTSQIPISCLMNEFTRSLRQGRLSDLRKYKYGGNAIFFCLALKLVSIINVLLNFV